MQASTNAPRNPHSLCVLIPYYNLMGYHGALRRYRRCTEHLRKQGVPYYTVEVVSRSRDPELDDAFLRIETQSILWHKEAALNALLRHIPPQHDCIAWIDRDILLLNDDWPHRATNALKRFPAVQLFEHLHELDPHGNVLRNRPGAVAAHNSGLNPLDALNETSHGNAWAMRRAVFEQHGLFDLMVVGGGDTLFVLACLGKLEIPPQWFHRFNPQIANAFLEWGTRLCRTTGYQAGFVPGTAQHIWHGQPEHRRYGDRHALVKDIDMKTDICRNSGGLLEWTSCAPPKMRLAVERYFCERQEDGTLMPTPEFTTDWFTSRIPILKKFLDSHTGRPGLRMLEVGSWEGRSSCWFLGNVLTHPSSSLTCIDTFKGSREHHATGRDSKYIERRFDHNVRLAQQGGALRKLKGRSQDLLPVLEPEAYDCIYIDGSHIAADVLSDTVLAWRLLKSGGILILDDYGHHLFAEDRNNPKAAIDAFLVLFHAEIDMLHKGWQVIVRKRPRPAGFPTLRIKAKRRAAPDNSIVSITWARDEEDILESFVRHNAAAVARMIVVLHRCTDSSHSILLHLQQEGLPVETRAHDAAHHAQSEVLTELMREVASVHRPRWILPLDADEFLCATERVSDVLSAVSSDTVFLLPWKTYVPVPQDDPREPDVRLRITHRRAEEPHQYCKVLIPALFAQTAVLPLGSHALLKDDARTPWPAMPHERLWIAHFPVRSEKQLRAKIIRGWEAYSRDPHKVHGQSFHWEQLYGRCLENAQINAQELQNIALHYATPGIGLHTPALVHDPITSPACIP